MLIMSEKTAVKQPKKIGGSLMLALTGYVRTDKFYKVERSDKKIIISPIEL